MLITLSLLLLPLPPPANWQHPHHPTPEAVQDGPSDQEQNGPSIEERPLSPAEAVEAIQEALKGKDYAAAAATLEKLGIVPDKAVAKAAAAGLKSRDDTVRVSALHALRYNPDPSCLALLLKAKHDKRYLEDPVLAREYYLALGQKADKKALSVLTKNLHVTSRGDRTMQARIAAIGRVRDKASVEALMSLMTSGRARAGNPHMQTIRLALVVLTGVDNGGSELAWIKWWNDNKRKLKVSSQDWPLPNKKLDRQWKTLWATPQEKERMKEDREARRKQAERASQEAAQDGANG